MEHALLSASSAHRWLECPASPRFEAQFPETTSEDAEKGRLAHAICELKVLKKFTDTLTPRAYTTRLNKLKKDPLYEPEMDQTSDLYIEHLEEKAMGYDSPPLVYAEVKVDLSDYIPEGFGTCDCVMIGGDTLNITDYKHGKGVPVSAEGNPQMRLYALGALKKFAAFYGNVITKVRMTIDQPRIQTEPQSETITVDELKAWGESIKPRAQLAYSGFGEFKDGDHCRFCRGKAQCKTRAKTNTALEDFKDCLPPTAENTEKIQQNGGNLLTNEEIGELLERGKSLVQWYKDLEEYAQSALLKGEEIEGWKLVAGRSNRSFNDWDGVVKALTEAGYDEALLYERKPKTLTELEKLVGKKDFADKLGEYVVKPLGKPTLVPMSDKREPYSSAASDFAEVNNEKSNAIKEK